MSKNIVSFSSSVPSWLLKFSKQSFLALAHKTVSAILQEKLKYM